MEAEHSSTISLTGRFFRTILLKRFPWQELATLKDTLESYA